jgi:hypothetical protein
MTMPLYIAAILKHSVYIYGVSNKVCQTPGGYSMSYYEQR